MLATSWEGRCRVLMEAADAGLGREGPLAGPSRPRSVRFVSCVKETTVSFLEYSPGSIVEGGLAEGRSSQTLLGSHPGAVISSVKSPYFFLSLFSHLWNMIILCRWS